MNEKDRLLVFKDFHYSLLLRGIRYKCYSLNKQYLILKKKVLHLFSFFFYILNFELKLIGSPRLGFPGKSHEC